MSVAPGREGGATGPTPSIADRHADLVRPWTSALTTAGALVIADSAGINLGEDTRPVAGDTAAAGANDRVRQAHEIVDAMMEVGVATMDEDRRRAAKVDAQVAWGKEIEQLAATRARRSGRGVAVAQVAG